MNVTLILGGVRSGKSTRAVNLGKLARSKRVYFLATARRSDLEMSRRIAAHRRSRPSSWLTIEEPRRVPERLTTIPPGATVIVDCITLWIARMTGEGKSMSHIEERVAALCSVARRRKLNLIAVSNEVGSGVHAPTKLGRRFADTLGFANAMIAAKANRVELMVAGIPVAIKSAKGR